MYNKILKGVASVLGAALVLGSVVMSAVPAKAATSVQGADGYETSYAIGELSLVTNSETASVDGQKLSYASQYSQIFYSIPQEVIDAGLVGFKCASDCSGSEFALKIVNSEDLYTDIAVAYGSLDSYPVIEAGSRATANVIDFMNLAEGDNTITITGVVFVTDNAIAGSAAPAVDDTPAAGDDGAAAGADNAATTTPAAPKTGESVKLAVVVSVLGGLLLIAVAGMFVTEQKKRR